jgi:hypothetical protein
VTYRDQLAARGLKPLSALTEEEYWIEYHAALKRCEEKDIRCGCCNTMVMACPHWQKLRLVVCPSPSEQRLVEGR